MKITSIDVTGLLPPCTSTGIVSVSPALAVWLPKSNTKSASLGSTGGVTGFVVVVVVTGLVVVVVVGLDEEPSTVIFIVSSLRLPSFDVYLLSVSTIHDGLSFLPVESVL